MKKMKKKLELFIDAIEGENARLLFSDNSAFDFPALLLPDGAKEGMALDISLTLKEKSSCHDEIEDLLNSFGEEL